ncbi:MAG: tRNA (N6-isopentenyl adenosine(37)-C2)-methylthiotransferase MiaB [Candidatus Electrothrix aestuarii]|uniref:tRNA-2-methylthio-N(6)-dimethylallyladenosine synthase n=1 Tax=Candidatus Electrothrix aestuarii TaxID=3062594 RepID=A0AAU8LRH4_9BACT|nr:tRNA (N6-isopentenyl adenosine(37)-C2)-methylthiotransferase MiaB [Candidatus Electrothrix aestuarii]
MSKHVYIKTFGCQMNERDSEIMAQLLAQSGYIPVAEQTDADLVILNTCSIRAKAEQKVFSLLGSLRKQKKQQPELRIAVAGCVAQQEGKQIFRRMPHVDIVVGTQQLYQLPEMLGRLERKETNREISCNLEKEFSIPPFQRLLEDVPQQPTEFRKFVTIMQGCNNYCSYCVVPTTRGREISRPVADILEEVRILVARGIKEITLLGQNVNSYGCTNAVADEPIGFADLLKMVAAIPGVQRLRFTTSNPQDLSTELMRCFRDLPNLCPQFHLPVQAGSNAVLKRMNRKYTRELYLKKVAELRSYCPDIALCTDVIVGFPGETEEDFEQTMDLLETVRFHGSFSFKYSDRPHTRSADFPDKVEEQVKGERLQRFQSRQDEISLERNQEFLGKTVEVMIESNGESGTQGRTGTNHIVHFTSPTNLLPGDFALVTITHAGQHSLKGEPAAPEAS